MNFTGPVIEYHVQNNSFDGKNEWKGKFFWILTVKSVVNIFLFRTHGILQEKS